jgi:hypothetical protein
LRVNKLSTARAEILTISTAGSVAPNRKTNRTGH